jgi:hypothetical protein
MLKIGSIPLLETASSAMYIEKIKKQSLPVLSAPSLDKAHSDCAHPRQLVDSLEAIVYRLGQQSRKLLIVKNFQVAA